MDEILIVMKKLLLFFLITQLCFAQNYKFVYEYRFAPVKNKPDSLVVDYMTLETNGKQSYFYNTAERENDSLQAVGKPADRKMNINNINYYIVKNTFEKSVEFDTEYQGTKIAVPEKRPVLWKLAPEKMVIGNMNCQKATTTFGGRNWEAWFTNEIAVNDGPYKFYGLPGLIVKLNDSEHQHNFEIIQIKKNIASAFQPYVRPVVVSLEKYKLLEPYYSQAAFIDKMNVTKNGADIFLKNGRIESFGKEYFENDAKKLNSAMNKMLGAGDNPIER